MPRRTQVSSFTEISILSKEGIIKKFPMRRKEPILGYVPKNDEKKNLVHEGLILPSKYTFEPSAKQNAWGFGEVRLLIGLSKLAEKPRTGRRQRPSSTAL